MEKTTPIVLDPGTIQDMVTFYRKNVPIKSLADRYSVTEKQVRDSIRVFVKLHGRDNMEENENLIQLAENKLIDLAKKMKCGQTDSSMFARYRALLFWYTKADLNEGIVFIPKNLL